MNNNLIDCWFGDISTDDQSGGKYWDALSGEERSKANRLKNDAVRNRFILTSGKLRNKLAEFTGEQPQDIKLAKQTHGKPFMVEHGEIVFNLSHTANKMIIAVGYQCQLGVDIEVWKSRTDFLGLAGKCMATQEIIDWQSLPEGEKLPEFYRIWTRKEAFVKAVGRGIALGLKKCVVSRENPGSFDSVPASCGKASDWKVMDLDLEEGISGVVVVDNNASELKFNVMR